MEIVIRETGEIKDIPDCLFSTSMLNGFLDFLNVVLTEDEETGFLIIAENDYKLLKF